MRRSTVKSRRTIVDALLFGIVAVWAGMAASLVPGMSQPTAMADKWQWFTGCINQVPCPTVTGNCGCNTSNMVGTCEGLGFLCVYETNRCPGVDFVTGAFCTCASGCG